MQVFFWIFFFGFLGLWIRGTGEEQEFLVVGSIFLILFIFGCAEEGEVDSLSLSY